MSLFENYFAIPMRRRLPLTVGKEKRNIALVYRQTDFALSK
jgi:hypothetical protein